MAARKAGSLAASLFLAIAAAASDGQAASVVSLPFTVQYTSDQPLQRRDDTPSVNLGNSWVRYGQFLVNVSIGNPAQQINVKIDTATADSWFFGKGSCSSSRSECLGGQFDSSASSTYTKLSYPAFHIEYASPSDTEVDGTYFSDDLRMEGDLTLKNVTMIMATETQALTRGIMGIGFSNDSTLARKGRWYPTVIDEMLSQGKIGRRAYSLYMDSKDAATGTLLFGGYDKAKIDGDLTKLRLERGYDDFVVDLLSVGFTNSSGTFSWNSTSKSSGSNATEFPTSALIDAGASLLKLPPRAYDAFMQSLGKAVSGSDTVDCNFGTANSNPGSLNFVFGNSSVNTEIKVPYSDLAARYMNADGTYSKTCRLGVDRSTKSSRHSLGDTFLRSAYVVFDLDQRELSIGKLKHAASGLDIVALGANGKTSQGPTSTAGTASPTSSGASLTGSSGATPSAKNTGSVRRPVLHALVAICTILWLSVHQQPFPLT